MGGFIKQRTLAEAIAFFEAAEVTAAPVYDIGQFLDDPHVQERGIVVEAPDERHGRGAHARHRAASQRHARAGCATPAPAIGQHNHEIFSRIGYSDERIAALVAERRHLTWPSPAPAARR